MTSGDAKTIDRVIEVTRTFLAARGDPHAEIAPSSAICQDLLIFGIDVDDYVDALATEFGRIVFEVPWLRFTDQTASFRGCGCVLFLFWIAWQLMKRPFGGPPTLIRPDPRNHSERLTLGHVAAVIDAGEWFEPGAVGS